MSVTIINGKEYQVDEDGFLLDPKEWTMDFALYVAEQEFGQAKLNFHQWFAVFYFRWYVEHHNKGPESNEVLKAMFAWLGKDHGNTKYFSGLFPKGVYQQVQKIAGYLNYRGRIPEYTIMLAD